jgi:RNA polymerase sigma-70 factor (ECF subfamily)
MKPIAPHIIDAARSGDNKAIAAIMARYRPKMTLVIGSRVRDRLDVEDLTMKTFEDALLRLHMYTPTHAFSTWLFRVAVNNTTDFLRHQRPPTASISVCAEVASSMPTPDIAIIQAEGNARLHMAISKLKPKARAVIEGRLDGYSFEEIAEANGMNPTSARVLFSRNRARLKKLLKTL